MGIAVVFACLVVQVGLAKRGQLFEPLVNIVNQAVFVVVHENAGGDVHGRDQRHAVGHATGLYDLLHLRCDVNVFAVLFGVESQIFSVKFHLRLRSGTKTSSSSLPQQRPLHFLNPLHARAGHEQGSTGREVGKNVSAFFAGAIIFHDFSEPPQLRFGTA
jgi:hypothetical protein